MFQIQLLYLNLTFVRSELRCRVQVSSKINVPNDEINVPGCFLSAQKNESAQNQEILTFNYRSWIVAFEFNFSSFK